jgi:hypothetical protein
MFYILSINTNKNTSSIVGHTTTLKEAIASVQQHAKNYVITKNEPVLHRGGDETDLKFTERVHYFTKDCVDHVHQINVFRQQTHKIKGWASTSYKEDSRLVRRFAYDEYNGLDSLQDKIDDLKEENGEMGQQFRDLKEENDEMEQQFLEFAEIIAEGQMVIAERDAKIAVLVQQLLEMEGAEAQEVVSDAELEALRAARAEEMGLRCANTVGGFTRDVMTSLRESEVFQRLKTNAANNRLPPPIHKHTMFVDSDESNSDEE